MRKFEYLKVNNLISAGELIIKNKIKATNLIASNIQTKVAIGVNLAFLNYNYALSQIKYMYYTASTGFTIDVTTYISYYIVQITNNNIQDCTINLPSSNSLFSGKQFFFTFIVNT